MSTINRLSSVDVLQPSDQIPVWDSSNGDTRKASMSTLLAFVEANFADPDYVTRVVAPSASGFNVDIGPTGDSTWLIVNPADNYALGSISLPPTTSAANDQEVTVVFTSAVAAFSVTSAGATVLGAPTRVDAYDAFTLRYNTAQLTWYALDNNVKTVATAKGFGAVGDGVTDDTAAVQRALDTVDGGVVYVNDGVSFNLSQLVFPDNVGANGYYVLDYRANDDVSSPSQPGANATNERVRFTQNSNASGYNNETQFSSGYSTGLVMDVRRDVNAPNIGVGQTAEFGRTSAVWRQDGLNRVQFKFTDSAGDTSAAGVDDGWTSQFWEPRTTLTNIKQSSFSATLALNDMVKGVTTGARGWVKAIDAGSITVTLLSGNTSTDPSGFRVGEGIILEPAVETSTDAVTAVSAIAYTTRGNRLGFSGKNIGNMFSNVQGDKAVYPFVLGGIMGIQQANNINGTVTNAEIILADDFGTVTQQARIQLEAATGDITFLNGTGNVEVLRLENLGGAGAASVDYFRATTELQATSAKGTIRLGTAGSNPVIIKGAGSPEGVEAAGPGSMYLNTSGGAGTTLYVKEGGVSTTGWAAK
jgi:hypothetical protein